MKCCICDKIIKPTYFVGKKGLVKWDKGCNPYPIKKGKGSRCCYDCDKYTVLPLRLTKSLGISTKNAMEITEALDQSWKAEEV